MIKAKALDQLFHRLDQAISEAEYLPMSGQIRDATLVAAPRQRNTNSEKEIIKGGEIPEDWKKNLSKLRQKDRDARWTVKFSKEKLKEDGSPQMDIAIPVFGYKSHLSIDRRHGIICRFIVTDAAASDGARLREGLRDPNNTASPVWADTAYRSKGNEEYLLSHGKVSRIHCRKLKGKSMTRMTEKANTSKSKVRSRVEHVFAEQKSRMNLFIRTIGKARAEAAITLVNMAYNMKRWCWLHQKSQLA